MPIVAVKCKKKMFRKASKETITEKKIQRKKEKKNIEVF